MCTPRSISSWPEVALSAISRAGAYSGGRTSNSSDWRSRSVRCREHRNFYANFLVPTTAEQQGDFSDLLNPTCSSQTVLLNPLALMQGSAVPFTNITDVLPQADPVGQGLVNLYPVPNHPDATCGAPNYTGQADRQVNYDTYTGRFDHQFGPGNSLFLQDSRITCCGLR
jgi:hypothetical protein